MKLPLTYSPTMSGIWVFRVVDMHCVLRERLGSSALADEAQPQVNAPLALPIINTDICPPQYRPFIAPNSPG